MKKMFLNFAEQMLSKDQMKKVKGGCGGTIYCGYTIYFQGLSITGYGTCGCSTIADCDAINAGQVGYNAPNNIGIVSHGCWQGAA